MSFRLRLGGTLNEQRPKEDRRLATREGRRNIKSLYAWHAIDRRTEEQTKDHTCYWVEFIQFSHRVLIQTLHLVYRNSASGTLVNISEQRTGLLQIKPMLDCEVCPESVPRKKNENTTHPHSVWERGHHRHVAASNQLVL